VSGQVLAPPTAPPLVAFATVGGNVPVVGATVELIRVNRGGGQSGSVIGTATTSSSGRFSIEIPDDATMGPRLVLRVRGGRRENDLHSFVLSRNTDIDPGDEYIFRKLTAGDNGLDNVTSSEVRALRTSLSEYDVGDATTVSEAIANLSQAADREVDPLVDAAVGPDGDATMMAGDYHLVQFAVEIATEPGQLHFVENGTITLQDSAATEGNLTNLTLEAFEAELMASANGTGGANYALDVATDNSAENVQIPFHCSASGEIFLVEAATEQIGASSGTRDAAAIRQLIPFSSSAANGAHVGSFIFDEKQYGLTPGNELDLGDLRSANLAYSLSLTGRMEAISNTLLDGQSFGTIGFGELFESDGDREAFADLGIFAPTMTSATTGTATVTDDIVSLYRTVSVDSLDAVVAWGDTGAGGANDPIGRDDGGGAPGYTLDPDTGAITLSNLNPGEAMKGFVANGGDLLVLGNTQSQQDETENGVIVGLKLGTANPSVTGRTFRVTGIARTYGADGSTGITRLKGSNLSVNGANVFWTLPIREGRKDDDLAGSIASANRAETDGGTLAFDGTNGQATMLIQGAKLTGYFNADGTMGVFRYAVSDLGGAGDEGTVGILILIRE